MEPVPSFPIGPAADLYEQFTPPAMLARLAELIEHRGDVKALRLILDQRGLLSWLHSCGVCADPALAALVPPLPPMEIRRITAATESEMFLVTGLLDLMSLLTVYRQAAIAPTGRTRVLDFGCGGGRLLRFFCAVADRWDATGVDVNSEMATWCAASLPDVASVHVGVRPPLPFPDADFDLVYSFSVFTHLDQESSHEWLSELRRILRPQALLVATTHGHPFVRNIQRSEHHQRLTNLGAEQGRELEVEMMERGFAFVPYPAAAQESTQVGDGYGTAFVSGDYVNEQWSAEGFEVLVHRQGGLRGQDVVVAPAACSRGQCTLAVLHLMPTTAVHVVATSPRSGARYSSPMPSVVVLVAGRGDRNPGRRAR